MLQAVLERVRMRNSSRKWLADDMVMNGRKNADEGQCCKNFCGFFLATPAPVPKWWQCELQDWQHVGQPRAWSAVWDKTFSGYLNPYTIHL